jgi:hypothetical protein
MQAKAPGYPQGSCFTFDNVASGGANRERWYTFGGNVSSVRPQFNQPPSVPLTATVGSGTLAYTSCTAATLLFSFTSGSNAGQAGAIALTRVGPTPASCVF